MLMNLSEFKDRIGVCGWSLQPDSPQTLARQLNELRINKLQCALDPVRENPAVWGDLKKVCSEHGITIVSGMFGCVGEDYSTLESIKRTGGIVPDDTWEENLRNIQKTAAIAEQMGIKFVTFHAGFIPHQESDPSFNKLLKRLQKVADVFAQHGLDLGLETGQETADTLKNLLNKLGRKNVYVNFDPANMILYDKGNPIEALRVLAPYVRQCHLKDATRTKVPGTWGEEVVLGTGEVDWKAFFNTLAGFGFSGFLCIEREAGNQRMADIKTAREYVERLLS